MEHILNAIDQLSDLGKLGSAIGTLIVFVAGKKRKIIIREFKKLFKHKRTKYHILFIDDDHDQYRLIDSLKREDDFSVRAIKDARSLSQEEITWAHAVFVDIHGVGIELNLEGQGKDLALGIKRTHPEKKVVLYSTIALGDIFDTEIDELDWRIRKTRRATDVINQLNEWNDAL